MTIDLGRGSCDQFGATSVKTSESRGAISVTSESFSPIPADIARRLHFWPDLEFAAQVEVTFRTPVVLGETPDGLRVNFYAKSGTIKGAITGRVLRNSADYMLVRRDGMGLIDIRATLETKDAARLLVHEVGLVDFGQSGYQSLLSGDYEGRPRLQTYMRLLTEAPRYTWVNRVSFLAIGEANMKELRLQYDLFAVRTHENPGPS